MRRETITTPSGKDLSAAVNAAAGHISGLWLFLLATCTYLAITVSAVDHEMLLRESGIRLPFFDLRLPLVRFFQVVPFMVLVLHANLLLYLVALWRRLLAFGAGERRWLVTLHPMAAVQRLTLGGRDRRLRGLFELAFVVPILLPTAVLLLMQWAVLPYRDGIAVWVALLVTVDGVLLVSFFLPAFLGGRRESRWFRAVRLRGRPAIGAIVVFAVGAAFFSWVMFVPPSWQKLVVRERLLVREEPPLEVVAQLLDTGQEAEEIVRRYSKGLDLSGRDLRGADLAGSRLFNVDLRDARLDDAVLDRVDVRGGRLDGATLTAARLRRAVLTGVSAAESDFSAALMEGVRFEGGRLNGANMDGASAEKAFFVAADLSSATLDRAVLRSADLTAASLEGASLIGTDASEAILLAAFAGRSVLYLTRLRGADLRAVDFDGNAPWAADLTMSRLWGAGDLKIENSLLWKASVRGALFALPQDGSADLRDLDLDTDVPPAGGWAEILGFYPQAAGREWLIADGGRSELSRRALERLEVRRARAGGASPPALPAAQPPLRCVIGKIACRLVERLDDTGATADTLETYIAEELRRLDPLAEDRVEDPWDDLWRSIGRVRADPGVCAPGGTESCEELTRPRAGS